MLGTAAADDHLVLQEDDEQFELIVEASRSGSYVVITSGSRDTTEVWLVPAADPTAEPVLVEPRRKGVEYTVAHAPRPDGDRLLIVTNDGAPRVPAGARSAGHARVASTGRSSSASTRRSACVSADVFAEHVVLTVHSLGRQLLRIVRRDGAESALDVGSGDPAASIALWRNEDPDATEVTVVVESWIQPPTWFALDLDTGRPARAQARGGARARRRRRTSPSGSASRARTASRSR